MTRRSPMLLVGVAVSVASLLAPAAFAQTVKEQFEKADLLGRYSQDCTKPTAEQNLTIVHQAIEGDRVRHDRFTSPTARQLSLTVDRASQSKPNEVSFSGLTGNKRHNVVLRLDGKKIRLMDSGEEGGEVVIAGGRYTNGTGDTPWYNKCLGPESNVVQGTFPPDRINADIETAAQTRQKSNPNPAPRGSFFKIIYARNANEFASLGRFSVMLLTAISQKQEELPLKRVYHRAGQEHTITKVSSWRSDVPASMLAHKIYGPYREDGFYIIPTGYMVRDGQLLIDYATGAVGVAILKLPSTAAPDATKNFPNLDPAPGAKPNLAALQKFIREKFPGFPVPMSVP